MVLDFMFVNTFRNLQKGFTLIEVLVVIGILGILATVALVAINPAEAQKKARDTQRLKDMSTLQSIIEEYLSDNPGSTITKKSSGTGTNKACAATGWLGINLCPYVTVVPTDPASRTSSYTTNLGTTGSDALEYFLNVGSGGYKLCTYLESTSNKAKVDNNNDGGIDPNRFEIGSDTTLTCE